MIFCFYTCLLFLGFVLLSLTITRHRRQLGWEKSFNKRAFLVIKGSGFALLIVSMGLMIYQYGVALGLVCWVALLTLAALILTFLLSYYSSYVKPLWLLASVFIVIYLVTTHENTRFIFVTI